MAELVAAELDRVRGERNYHYAIIRHLAGGLVLGPFATQGQAAKAAAKHPALISYWTPNGFTAEGLDRLIAEVDKPAAKAVDPEIAVDAQLFKLGWRGNKRDRHTFVQRLALQ